MLELQTSHGTVPVTSWGYQLQGLSGADLDPAPYAASPHDMVVVDYSRNGRDSGMFTAEEVAAIEDKPGGGVSVAYVSIGEASEFRDNWNPAWTSTGLATGSLTAAAPHWLGPVNPDWPESRKVRYWEAGWQDLVFNDAKTGSLDSIVAQGFDAAYLDIVDAYYFWAVEAGAAGRLPGDPAPNDERDAAARMIDFIAAMTAHARETNPDFFVIQQNGGYIIDALAGLDPGRKAALLGAIGGIAVEDLYLRGGSSDENNAFAPDEAQIEILKRDFLANGKAVFVVDYTNDPVLVGRFVARALSDGFIPAVAPDRDLDRPFPALARPDGATDLGDLVAGTAAAETIHGLGGNDWIYGFAGNDRLYGDGGNDVLVGGSGNDTLDGGSGNDRLLASAGSDRLVGSAGADRFILAAAADSRGAGTDRIAGFEHGRDRIDVHSIDAMPGTSGNQPFRWIGSQSFHRRDGELRFHDTGRNGYVEGDANGDGHADFRLLVLDVSGLSKGDLIL